MKILQYGNEYLDSVLEGNPESLAYLFHTRIAKWNEPLVSEDECTYGLFNDVEESIKPYIAFDLIPATLDILHSCKKPSEIDCAMWLLLGLVESTETTEAPPALKSSIQHINELAKASGESQINTVKSISEYYRNGL
ncbi:hypothetical protein TUM4438_45450 [Shewanella sairae]|uniref:Immunity protein 30 domain-containing protein n=1 Tax=Shewanella sairae TaxID=190310 RepID=A0ABQ4PRR9_9GAMM|nr:hypothetical protein [Shewanella sairae]MCL1132611.1 hypothetical protein [Shewanella sairae]GIU52516.1 hypothetical protein TUM4438_45450 [Shewanella sairae]